MGVDLQQRGSAPRTFDPSVCLGVRPTECAAALRYPTTNRRRLCHLSTGGFSGSRVLANAPRGVVLPGHPRLWQLPAFFHLLKWRRDQSPRPIRECYPARHKPSATASGSPESCWSGCQSPCAIIERAGYPDRIDPRTNRGIVFVGGQQGVCLSEIGARLRAGLCHLTVDRCVRERKMNVLDCISENV